MVTATAINLFKVHILLPFFLGIFAVFIRILSILFDSTSTHSQRDPSISLHTHLLAQIDWFKDFQIPFLLMTLISIVVRIKSNNFNNPVAKSSSLPGKSKSAVLHHDKKKTKTPANRRSKKAD